MVVEEKKPSLLLLGRIFAGQEASQRRVGVVTDRDDGNDDLGS